jgi:hypothetical protein
MRRADFLGGLTGRRAEHRRVTGGWIVARLEGLRRLAGGNA